MCSKIRCDVESYKVLEFWKQLNKELVKHFLQPNRNIIIKLQQRLWHQESLPKSTRIRPWWTAQTSSTALLKHIYQLFGSRWHLKKLAQLANLTCPQWSKKFQRGQANNVPQRGQRQQSTSVLQPNWHQIIYTKKHPGSTFTASLSNYKITCDRSQSGWC